MSSVLLRIEELKGDERQGIGSILEFSGQTNERRQSLRRTFSADMSSKKWTAENLPISLRKISSAEEFSTMPSPNTSSASSSSGDEEEKERVRKDLERPEQFDIWSAIQSQKTTNTDSLPTTPYIHPLVKRSKSLLSEKSLQICTESLGSETGSDGFSSSDYFPSDSSDDDEEEESEEEEVRDEMQGTKEELVQVNYNCSISRRSPTRSFPPPLPSLSSHDGACLRMRPHREGGRLIVAAIPVISQKFLHAEREGGRLRLSLITPPVEKVAFVPPQQEPEIQFMEVEEEEEEEEEEAEEEVEQVEEEEEEEEKKIVVVENRGLVMEVEVVKKEEAVMRVGQPILMMNNKIIGGMHTMHLNNPDPWMGKKFNDQDGPRRVFPLRAAASFNGYDLCWKTGTVAHSAKMPITNKLMVSKKPQQFKGEDLFNVKRCKEYRRPVVVGKPFCIATT